MVESLLRSERGNRFIANHATKGSRRYRYYVEQLGDDSTNGPSPKALRLPAREIEEAVLAGLKSVLADRRGLLARFSDLGPTQRSQVAAASNQLVDHLSSRRGARESVRSVVRSVEYRHDRLVLTVSTSGLAEVLLGATSIRTEESNASPDQDLFVVTTPLTLRRRGVQMKLTILGQEPPRDPDPSLVTAIVRAWDWADRLVSGKVSTIAKICAEEGFSDTYVGQLLRVAFLPPETVENVLAGQQDPSLSADQLIWDADVPTLWIDRQVSSPRGLNATSRCSTK